jgi:PAS domain S-box-containing protein
MELADGWHAVGILRDIGERKEAEKTMRLQSLVLSQIQDYVTVTDLDGIIAYVNEAEARVIGLPPEQLVGASTEVYGEDPARGARQREIVEATLRDGHWRGEVVNYAADGREFIVDCRTQVVLDEQGERIALCGVSTDITEQKRTEAALRESEQTFRNIVQSSPMGIHLYQLRADGALVFSGANPMADKLLGVEHAPLIGKTIEEAFPPLAETEIPERYRQVVREGGTWHTEQIDYPGGEIEGTFEVYAFQMSPGKLAVMFSDITARKEAEEALRANEEMFRGLFENHAAVKLLVAPESGRIVDANQAAATYYGWSRERLRQMLIFDVNTLPEQVVRTEMRQLRVPPPAGGWFGARRGGVQQCCVLEREGVSLFDHP